MCNKKPPKHFMGVEVYCSYCAYSGPPQKCYVLLTAKPLLQPLNIIILIEGPGIQNHEVNGKALDSQLLPHSNSLH